MKYTPAIKQTWAAVKAALQFGASVESGHWLNRSSDGRITRVCACGAVLAALGIPKTTDIESGPSVIRAVARKLKITVDQAVSLNNGFEGSSQHEHYAHGAGALGWRVIDRTWFNVGRAIRRYAEKHS